MAARWRSGLTAREETRQASFRAIELIRLYAQRRRDDVGDGYLTPRLAAVQVQAYSKGVLDTFTEHYGERAARPVGKALEEAVHWIDSDYRQNRTRRWSQRPADLA
jgi:hypothetical protein